MQGKMEGAESGTGGDQTRGMEIAYCFYLFGFASFSLEVKDEEREGIGWVFTKGLPTTASTFVPRSVFLLLALLI
jgi:hypothetical protein